MAGTLVAVPLEADDYMEIGYITLNRWCQGKFAAHYIEALEAVRDRLKLWQTAFFRYFTGNENAGIIRAMNSRYDRGGQRSMEWLRTTSDKETTT